MIGVATTDNSIMFGLTLHKGTQKAALYVRRGEEETKVGTFKSDDDAKLFLNVVCDVLGLERYDWSQEEEV